jgi:hypothetical protein
VLLILTTLGYTVLEILTLKGRLFPPEDIASILTNSKLLLPPGHFKLFCAKVPTDKKEKLIQLISGRKHCCHKKGREGNA